MNIGIFTENYDLQETLTSIKTSVDYLEKIITYLYFVQMLNLSLNHQRKLRFHPLFIHFKKNTGLFFLTIKSLKNK